MPIEWPFKSFTQSRNWGDMPYDQRMRRIKWFALVWKHYLDND